ncbi:MAG: hypothetical protein ACP5JJ_13300 [Anaerolineae bacterium]
MTFKQKSIFTGAVLGAGLGALGGYLFTRGIEMPRDEHRNEKVGVQGLPPGELVKIFIAIMGVLRGVAELGERA